MLKMMYPLQSGVCDLTAAKSRRNMRVCVTLEEGVNGVPQRPPGAPDDGLSSLQWLHGFSAQQPPELLAPGFNVPSSPLAGDPAPTEQQGTLGRPPAAAAAANVPTFVVHGHCPDDVDYRTNGSVKPPYSHATLIRMAMEDREDQRVTLSDIYKYIGHNYCYYRHAHPAWKNSIRHTLSTYKCFTRVPRQKGGLKKGGFWTMDPQYSEPLLRGGYRNKEMPQVTINPVVQNRLQADLLPPYRNPCNSVGPQTLTGRRGGSWVPLSIQSEAQHLLRDSSKGADQNRDPNVVECSVQVSQPVVQKYHGLKRKRSPTHRDQLKLPRTSHSPLPSVNRQELTPLLGDLDWDPLFESAINRELGLEGEGLQYSTIDVGDLDLELFKIPTDSDLPDFDEAFLDLDEALL